MNTKDEVRRQVSKHKLKAQISMHSMMLPALIFAIIFSIFPLFGLIMAFQEYKPSSGFLGSQFVDVYNFTKLFSRPDFWDALINTVVIAVAKIIAITILPRSPQAQRGRKIRAHLGFQARNHQPGSDVLWCWQ